MTSMNNQDNKVIIIGAGLGGLVLAQILHRHRTPFEIFERDETTSSRKQGWAVALVECLPPLEELLPEETVKGLYTNSVNANTGDCDEIGFINAITSEKAGHIGGVHHGEPGYFLRVSREHFRTYLWEANNLPITTGKKYQRYESDDRGVTAYFADGTSTRGSLLVGANGIHSHVLDQLVGESHHRPVLSKYVPIFGEVEIPPKLYEPLRKLGTAAILTGAPHVRQQIGMLHMAEDKSSAAFFWALMPHRQEPKELSDWVQSASQQEIYDFALDLTKDLHPTMTDLMRYGGPKSVAAKQPKFLEFVPPEDMPAGRVTVLGDAAHAMIPFRGAGANTAILDACDIGKMLVKAFEEGKDLASVIKPYHEVMVPRGKDNVLSSRAAGEGDDNPAEEWARKFKRPGKHA